MRALHPVRPHDYSAQLIIAAFDRWQDLSSALEPIGAKEGCCFRAVLHARKDLPEDLGLREAVNEIAKLGCNASGQPIATGEGRSPAPWRWHSRKAHVMLREHYGSG
jgi:hypothetical protein